MSSGPNCKKMQRVKKFGFLWVWIELSNEDKWFLRAG
jgi:hypothetical protein